MLPFFLSSFSFFSFNWKNEIILNEQQIDQDKYVKFLSKPWKSIVIVYKRDRETERERESKEINVRYSKFVRWTSITKQKRKKERTLNKRVLRWCWRTFSLYYHVFFFDYSTYNFSFSKEKNFFFFSTYLGTRSVFFCWTDKRVNHRTIGHYFFFLVLTRSYVKLKLCQWPLDSLFIIRSHSLAIL